MAILKFYSYFLHFVIFSPFWKPKVFLAVGIYLVKSPVLWKFSTPNWTYFLYVVCVRMCYVRYLLNDVKWWMWEAEGKKVQSIASSSIIGGLKETIFRLLTFLWRCKLDSWIFMYAVHPVNAIIYLEFR